MSGGGLTWSERANWGLLIGGFAMEAAAILFFVIAWAASIIRVSFIVTGVIMALGGLLLLVLGWGNDEEKDDDERIRNSGISGSATVEAVQPTGVVVHKQPQLSMSSGSISRGSRPTSSRTRRSCRRRSRKCSRRGGRS